MPCPWSKLGSRVEPRPWSQKGGLVNRNAKSLQRKAAAHRVSRNGSESFQVVSGSSGATYDVTEDGGLLVCTCTWSLDYHYRGEPCSHVLAVERFIEEEAKSRRLSFWATPEAAARQHRPTRPISGGLLATSRKGAT